MHVSSDEMCDTYVVNVVCYIVSCICTNLQCCCDMQNIVISSGTNKVQLNIIFR